jgi:uncharacterized protein
MAFIFFFFISAIMLVFSSSSSEKIETQDNYKTQKIKINNIYLNVEVADTKPKQALGLGNQVKLDTNSGMLFPFTGKSKPYFWMKDMLIPLDIIWILDNKIIDIDKNVPNLPLNTPENKLPTYLPDAPINMVLEVNSGFCDKNNIKIGDTIYFE